MMHEIGRELEARLQSKGCPLKVVDRERTKPAGWVERIVIEEDGDTFAPVRSQHINAKHRFTRAIGGKLTIYARSGSANATEWEHRRRAETILDLVLCAMAYVAAVRRNAWSPKSGAFVVPEDFADAERLGGAAYELKFAFDRGVLDRTWTGAIAAEASLAGISSTTKVSLRGGADDDDNPLTVPATAETACGA